MIQRFLGGAIGALVTIGILWWNHVDTTLAATAAIVGAIAAFFWPIVVGFFLARRGEAAPRAEHPGRGRAPGSGADRQAAADRHRRSSTR